jgi:antitoxin component YwqK of YwqJK toxin-antitoxin module
MLRLNPIFALLALTLFIKFSYAQNIGDMYPSPRILITEGIELHDNKEYINATEKYLACNKNDSFYAWAQYELSLSYFAAKEYQKAKDAALEGLKTNNEYKRDLWLAYANALEEGDQFDSAILVYDKIIKDYPDYYLPYYEKALAYERKDMWEQALATYTEALKKNIYHPTSHLRIGLLAAGAQQPAIALMAMQMHCMLNNTSSNIGNVLIFMEQVANNQYSPEKPVPSKVFVTDELLEELNAVILSKGALSKKYKSKLNIDYHINKQLQVLMEKLPEQPQTHDWLTTFYVKFYKELWNNNHFEGSILHTFKNINASKVQKEINSKQKKINDFAVWGDKYLTNIRANKTIIVDGKETPVKFWFTKGHVTGIGNVDENEKNHGPWTFYNTQDYKQAEGVYEHGNKVGIWKYYYFNGTLKAQETFLDGKLHGEYTEYYENGALSEKATYENGKYVGELILYNPNNTIRSKIPIVNDKINGVRYSYDANGYLSYAGEVKDGVYEGWYKTYYRNGQVNLDGQTLKDQLHGTITYYYESGKLKTAGNFNNGQRTGAWKWLYENGNPSSEGEYNNSGKEIGTWKYYKEDGKLRSEEIYDNGKKGRIKNYDENGKVYAELTFKNSNIDSYKYYDENGKIFAEAKTSGGKLNYLGYNQYRNKLSEGKIVNGNDEGVWKYYYANGQLERESNFTKGKQNGLSTEYYKNGKIKAEASYTNGTITGYYKYYYINGQLKVSGYYNEDGDKVGPWNFYHMNGKLESEEFFIDGKLAGMLNSYYPDGKMQGYFDYSLGFFNNYYEKDTSGVVYNASKLTYGTGEYKLYTPKMKVDFTGQYVQGLRDGKFTSWDGAGKITREEYYQFGKRNGLSKSYHYNGKLKSVGMYKNGDQDSIWNYYYENGSIQRVSNFKDDELDGKYISYYSNGKIETDRNYLDGSRHGDYKYYNPDGTLILWVKYQNGVMMSYTYPDKNGEMLPFTEVKDETAEVKTYYPNGTLALSFKVEKGLFQGRFEVFSPSGKLISVNTYVDGIQTGESMATYANGNIMFECKKTDDELDGIYKTYHENGKLAREINMMYGYEHGICKEYDTNGKLIKQTNYLYGKVHE